MMGETSKICIKCKLEKIIASFYFRKDTQKYSNICSDCKRLYQHNHYKENREDILEYKKGYQQEHKEERAEYQREYREKNKEDLLDDKKEYYQNNKEDILRKKQEYYFNNRELIVVKQKQWREENKEYLRNYKNIYEKERTNTDPAFKLRKNVSRAVLAALQYSGGSKSGRSVLKYLPYSIDELKQHLEVQFEPWMSWDNHGSYNPKTWDDNDSTTWTWNIDHIIPQSSLLYTSMEDDNFQKCWALSNLRPLKSIDNIIKSDKLIASSK